MSRKVWTICPNCDRSVRVPEDKVTACKYCGAEIVPCEGCQSDCSECPYDRKVGEGSA